jgi:hypothetical protein
MKTMILASILALTAMAWTSEATAACFYCNGHKYGCGYSSAPVGAVPKSCQAKCENEKTTKQFEACLKKVCP